MIRSGGKTGGLVKVFDLKTNNHEDHEGHEENYISNQHIENFVFSAIAPALLYLLHPCSRLCPSW
jgi:hypothetical protein